MKKVVKIVLLIALIMIIQTTSVKAEEQACKINLSAEKTTIKPGETVTLEIKMTDITKLNGLKQILAVMEYDNTVFEMVAEEDENVKKEIEEKLKEELGEEFQNMNVKILYNGLEDESEENTWYFYSLELLGNTAIAGATLDPQIEDATIGKIKFKVKDNATTKETTIKLKETEVGDGTTNYKIPETSIKLQINGASGGNPSVGSGNQNQNGNVANQIKNTNNNAQSQKEAPYTGVEDFIPVIVTIIIIAILSYVNYNKYKEI